MISQHAIIHPNAKIGKNVHIGPWTIIGDKVEIGDNCRIFSHVVIKGFTRIGSDNQIFQFSSIGEDCQDIKYQGEPTQLIIGDRNIFRESCTVHRGTVQGINQTVIGNDNLFMANSHIAHDCIIGNNVIFAVGASVAGHVTVGDKAILGGLVGVHQFCIIGAYSFSAGGSIINKDVMPYVMISGYPAQVFGLNVVGLHRNQFSKDIISQLKQSYKIIFRTQNTIREAKEKLEHIIQNGCEEAKLMLDFLSKSTRGIIR